MAYSATQLQLTHILQRLYRDLGGKVTTATGGTVNTAIDTKLTDELGAENRDDIYNGGTLIVIKDAGGASAAPEGEFSRISDYSAATPTLTVSPDLTTAVASGDTILIGSPEFPLYDVIELVNDALKQLTETPRYDTSITTAANQTEYTLPVAVKGGRITNVEIQGITTDANDNRWTEIPHWLEDYASPGSAGVLRIEQFPSGYNIRITYKKAHARVSAYADPIDEHFHSDLIHAAVFEKALAWRNRGDSLLGAPSQALLALQSDARGLYNAMLASHRPHIPPRRVQGMVHWDTPDDTEMPPIPTP